MNSEIRIQSILSTQLAGLIEWADLVSAEGQDFLQLVSW